MLFDKFSPATRGAILLVCGTGLCGFLVTTWLTFLPVAPDLVEQAPFLFQDWQSADRMFWLWMFIIAVLASTALSLMTRAYQLAQTRYAEMFE